MTYGRSVGVRVKKDPDTGNYVGSLAMCYSERDGKDCGWVSFHVDYDVVVSDARRHRH